MPRRYRIGQSPPAGTKVARDSLVALTLVSEPASITLGDYTCVTYSSAKSQLEHMGLVVVPGPLVPPLPQCPNTNKVAAQDPHRGRRSSRATPSRSPPGNRHRPPHRRPGAPHRERVVRDRGIHRGGERGSAHFTSLDSPVFALVDLPEAVKGALFARYSRTTKSLRRLFLDEFAEDVAGGVSGSSMDPRGRRSSTTASSWSTATTRSRSSAGFTSRASSRRSCWRRHWSGDDSRPTSSSPRGTCATTVARADGGARPCRRRSSTPSSRNATSNCWTTSSRPTGGCTTSSTPGTASGSRRSRRTPTSYTGRRSWRRRATRSG